jgi:histidinol phosphatase-like enzyme
VLDNTYATRAARAKVVAIAKRHGIAVRCIVMTTSLEQAQANAVRRMLDLHGRLLEPAELGRAGAIGPGAQFRYRRQYEPPSIEEGFSAIEERASGAPVTSGAPALVVELDGIVWRGRPRTPETITLVPGAQEALAAWHAAGYRLAATSWQPEPADTAALDARLRELLALPIEVARCRHPAGPPVCWCRKPLPGLALLLARDLGLDLARSVHTGKGPADRGFAVRSTMRYVDVAAGWPAPPG